MQYFADSRGNDTFMEIGSWLQSVVGTAEPRLRAIRDDQASAARRAGAWSRKQILGHLIDSATNNHQRFIRAQGAAVLRLPGYAQDDWVLYQHYGERSWTDLVDFWCSYNRHLSHVIARIPEPHRGVPCEIGESSAVTLSYVALDYVGHVEHHLSQIFA
jgi:hypothetical protein